LQCSRRKQRCQPVRSNRRVEDQQAGDAGKREVPDQKERKKAAKGSRPGSWRYNSCCSTEPTNTYCPTVSGKTNDSGGGCYIACRLRRSVHCLQRRGDKQSRRTVPSDRRQFWLDRTMNRHRAARSNEARESSDWRTVGRLFLCLYRSS